MGVIEWKPEVFSNPKKGKKIFAALVQVLETQQSQLETLADERKRQEERIKVEYDSWISGFRSLQLLIDKLRRQMKLSEMARLVEAAKTNLVFGLKMKQELLYKLKLDSSEDELADFKQWFDILSHRCPTEKECPDLLNDVVEERVGESGSSKAPSTKKLSYRALEKEVKRLKGEYEKLSIKSSSQISELMSEKVFAWNQYREMESKYTAELQEKNEEVNQYREMESKYSAELQEKNEEVNQYRETESKYREMESKYSAQLQEKNEEVNQVNDRVGKLLETVEQLQSSSMEKDAQIADLKAKLAKKGESSKKEGDVSRFLEESTSLKKSKGGLVTPVLRACTAGRKAKAASFDEKHGSGRTPVTSICTAEPKAIVLSSDNEHGSRKTTRSGKRKPVSFQDTRNEKKRVASEEETPKLFTSGFKIPKLKGSSSLR